MGYQLRKEYNYGNQSTGHRLCQMKKVKAAGLDATITKVENVEDIMAYSVMSTPALVIDEEVKVYGKVPSPKEIAAFF